MSTIADAVDRVRAAADEIVVAATELTVELGAANARVADLEQRLEQCTDAARPALPRVGIGGSGAFGGLPRDRRLRVLDLMADCGITDFRTDCQWAGVERTQGAYSLAGIRDRCVDIVAAGLEPMVLTGWPPSFYRANPTAGGNSAPKDDAATLLAWRRYLQALFAALYAVGVRRFEIWNEPNFLFMQPVSPALWAKLVRIAHEVAAGISRHIVIVAGGVCPAVDTPPRSMGATIFYDAVLAADPKFFEVVDEVGIHPYAGNHTKLTAGQFWTKHAVPLRARVPAHVPLCGTEHGWKSVANTEAERVDLYVDSVLSWKEPTPLYLFSAFDFAEPYGLVDKDLNPKPVYHALKELLAS